MTLKIEKKLMILTVMFTVLLKVKVFLKAVEVLHTQMLPCRQTLKYSSFCSFHRFSEAFIPITSFDMGHLKRNSIWQLALQKGCLFFLVQIYFGASL